MGALQKCPNNSNRKLTLGSMITVVLSTNIRCIVLCKKHDHKAVKMAPRTSHESLLNTRVSLGVTVCGQTKSECDLRNFLNAEYLGSNDEI